jgi:hypothetical protein
LFYLSEIVFPENSFPGSILRGSEQKPAVENLVQDIGPRSHADRVVERGNFDPLARRGPGMGVEGFKEGGHEEGVRVHYLAG